jgi:DEAD/DEAH box helicase domain-containing protein
MYLDPSNPFIEEYQILAMACDRPILMSESTSMWKSIQKLISNDLLRLSNGRFVPNFVKALDVLRNFSIRGIGVSVNIIYAGNIIGERQMPQALEELHDGAVYFLSGRRYQVHKLHLDDYNQIERLASQPGTRVHYAELISLPNDYPYYTRAVVDKWPSILQLWTKNKYMD